VATAEPFGTFSVSPNGILLYRPAPVTNGQLTWFSVQGKVMDTVGPPGPYYGIALSPDETQVAYRDADFGQADIWTLDFARGVHLRLTSRHTEISNPVWSPDGSRIAYGAGHLGDTLFEKDSSGAGDEKELYKKVGLLMVPTSWSHDGRFLLYYTANTPKTGAGLWVLPLAGDTPEAQKPVLLLGTESNEGAGVFSPDMHWVAYISNESGRNEAYVRPFIASGSSGAPTLGEKKWQVSVDGTASLPWWHSDSKEIYFRGPDGGAVAVDMSRGPAQMGVDRQLFNLLRLKVDPRSGVMAADGERWLVSVAQRSDVAPFTVVINWPALVKK
jgi:Tol biopolymer transport system component